MTRRTVLVSMTMPPAHSASLAFVSPRWNDASAPIDDPRFTAASADSGTGSRKNRAEGTGSADWTLFPVPLHLLRPIKTAPPFVFILFPIRSRVLDRESDRVLLLELWSKRMMLRKGLDSIVRTNYLRRKDNEVSRSSWKVEIFRFVKRDRSVWVRLWCLKKINEVLENKISKEIWIWWARENFVSG